MPEPRRWKNRTPEEQAAADSAAADIRRLRSALDDAEELVRTRRKELAQGISRHVQAGAVTQAEAARTAGYDTRTVQRLVRDAGVPYVHPAKVREQQTTEE
ncbi:hypothetical protein [Streptomyces triticirhizae]|uniref:Helix-turn-helix domain-containing protein n=1 Tax=Streptomyces triticirhizae TaxID=2483353 RepID=A0A3M2M6D1_9ACTN|nr:hypothetical protein [Streptomyces triticirhizae]RMI44413.1 hypothetical protein EBN88_05275 [Streptomyces triticirhizae]